MDRIINLCDGKTQLVQLRRRDLNFDLEKQSHNLKVSVDQNRLFSIVISGFAVPVAIEISESAIARIHSEAFDIDVGLAISNLISDAIAKTNLIGMSAEKKIRIEDLSANRVDLSVSATKTLNLGEVSAIAGATLKSLAHAIEMDTACALAVARNEFGTVYITRLRTWVDDAEFMMSDDGDLMLSEQDKFSEMG